MRLSDVAGTSARISKPNLSFQDVRNAGRPKSRSLSAGLSLLEMLMCLAIILIMLAIALPTLWGNRRSYHLTEAATAVTGAIQAARYQAIMTGCSYRIQFDSATTTYQLKTQKLTGTPPACAANWSDVGGLTPWAYSSDVSMSQTTTLQFSPNGMVTATTGTNTFQLSNGFTTNTITVSGVGNVNVTTP